ncbi:hemicentin-1-like isoform X3 [Acropora millepora]|uniref:hemicentin-1-like isoform X3 n=1 Tax=Acropora millepora TaxID=45264 RepID=UPI001CF5414C|nr:hemicentin-1-like isoform X3 [Acropora millepora]
MAEAGYKNRRLCTFALIFHGILLSADAGSITWHEPPPSQIVTDVTVTFTSSKILTKGSLNEELSFNFSLTADLAIVSVTIQLDGNVVATYFPSLATVTVESPYFSRFNATWVPTKLTLIVLNVTSADKGQYRCEVLTTGGGINRWKRIIEVEVFERPKIIEVSGFSVPEGGNTTLKCLAEGKPTPNITWTRLSDKSNITSTRLSDGSVISRTLLNITKQDAILGYRCTAINGVGNPDTRDVFIDVQFAPEKASLSTNVSTVPVVCAGMVVKFTCTVEANPKVDTFALYENGRMISDKTDTGVWITTLGTGGEVTYKCEANNSIGTGSSENISFTIEVSASATAVCNGIVAREGQNVTLGCNGFGLPAPSISWFNESNVVMENGRIWSLYDINRNMAGQYTCTASNSCGHDSQKIDVVVQYHVEATGSGENATVPEGGAKKFSCPVAGNPTPNIKWFKGSELRGTPISNEKELEATENGCYTCLASNSLGTSVSITQCLTIVYESSSTVPSTTVSEDFKCNCPNDKETTLSVVIGVLVIIIVVLIAVIIWQQKKLRSIGNKRPYEVPEEKDTGCYDNEIAMKHVDPTHLRPKNSTQQQIPNEQEYMPLQGISPTGEGSISPESLGPNVEYAPLDVRTRSWEVARNDVKVEKIIGKGAFGQVAAGTAKNLPFRSGTITVAIKMTKANAPKTDKGDFEAELELMKTLKPHPHVIRLLGCVTESEPLLVLIEYVPYGDLLGYLRKSRGLNDTYYKDPDIKPKTSLTSQQLMKFAWQIADGMSYLSLRKASLSLRDGTTRIAYKN